MLLLFRNHFNINNNKTFTIVLLQRNTDPEATFAGLKEKLLDTLRNLHRERDEQGLQVEMWCHFARVYLYGIDEGIANHISSRVRLCKE